MAEPGRARRTDGGFAARLAVGLLLATIAGGCTSHPGAPTAAPDAAANEAGPAVPYRVEFKGVDDAELQQLLKQVSETERLVDRPPPSLVRLRSRAEGDRSRLQEALRSRGYYDAEIALKIDSDAEPVRVRFEIKPGPLYRFRDVTIKVMPPEPRPQLPSLEELKIEPGAPAVSETILDAESALVARARAQGYALAAPGQRQAIVDHDTHTMDLTLALRPGALVRFGAIRLSGLTDVKEDAVRRRLGWSPAS